MPTGTGMVKCAHGLMPIPAPGTAELLKGVPLAASVDQGRADDADRLRDLDDALWSEWMDEPAMTVERIGHGAGRREFVEQPNVLRLFVGVDVRSPKRKRCDRIWILETNLDDVPAEVIGYCFDQLFTAGRWTYSARRSR